MHISSLPSPYGIGTFGKTAYEFVDFLKKSKMKVWQILPLNVTSYGDSPYQSPSNYGFNYYFIDLDILISKGLLNKKDLSDIDFGEDESRVNYKKIFDNRINILKKAFSNFSYDDKFTTFLSSNTNARDFSFFMTLKELHNHLPWFKRKRRYRRYSLDIEKETITTYKNLFEFYMWTQYEFIDQYSKLKEYANKNDVKIMGDLPIYLAYDSVECYKYPKMFQFDKKHRPTRVAGCPPDSYSIKGQLWGNPLYDWDYHKETNYSWWNNRIKNALKLYDLVRIDHFRGFSGYYSIKFKAKDAINGEWIKGPGFDLFKDKLNYPIVAEDLGKLDEDFYQFMNQTGYPGMKILIEGVGHLNPYSSWRPRNYDAKCYSYSSTHDSETTLQFINSLSLSRKEEYIRILKEECEYFNITIDKLSTDEDITNKIVELNLASNSKCAITPIQDLFPLGIEARMNFPSTLSIKNWSWRLTNDEFNKRKDEFSTRLSTLVQKYKR